MTIRGCALVTRARRAKPTGRTPDSRLAGHGEGKTVSSSDRAGPALGLMFVLTPFRGPQATLSPFY